MVKAVTSKFNFVPVASSLCSHVDIERVIATLAPGLEKIGGVRGDVSSVTQPDPMLLLLVSGGTERQVLRLRERRARALGPEPTLLLTHGDRNSLPAALEILARLHQEGAPGKIFVCTGADDIWCFEQVGHAIEDVAVWRAMHTLRLGLVGGPSDWLVASDPQPSVVREIWGPEIVRAPMEELVRSIEEVKPEDLKKAHRTLVKGIKKSLEPGRDDIVKAIQVSLGIRELVRSQKLGAITLRCFDLLTSYETTGCLALADLNDTGIVAGCEGDVPSTLTMLWLTLLTGERVWMANPARVDTATNELVLAHCTIARSLASEVLLRSHFESGIGVALQGTVDLGPVTLARIGGRTLEQVWLAEGELLESEADEGLCRTQVRVSLDYGHVSELLQRPLGNHLVMARGRHLRRLRAWHEMMLVHDATTSGPTGVINQPVRSSRHSSAAPDRSSNPPPMHSSSRPPKP